MIKVVVVDDSAVARDFLVHLIDGTPGMKIVGTARDGREAVDLVAQLRPDIVTMDIVMPRMSGPEAIDHIMRATPTPIVVVTGNTITEEVRATFESLDSGALAIVPRPYGAGCTDHVASTQQLLNTLRLMSEIKVVRRLPRRRIAAVDGQHPTAAPAAVIPDRPFRVVAVGASTGGPSVLKSILTALPKNFHLPILVVQHMAAGFIAGFVSWLQDTSHLPTRVATAGEALQPGVVYVAPDGAHLGVGGDERITLTAPTAGGLCPSVDRLFESVRQVYGGHVLALLLTGMGRDGAEGLLRLRQAGAMTLAQDKESSVVFGMPGEAVALGAATYVVPPPKMAELLTSFAATHAADRR